ncbi:MAG: OsmC family protein [Actinomycetota bacterium]
MSNHLYTVELTWLGNQGSGTSSYQQYSRDHSLSVPGKDPILGSSDPSFRGNPARWNPEELLVASLAQCHMLWYLHLAATRGIVVTKYGDRPQGVMHEDPEGKGNFTHVTLRPAVTVAQAAMRKAALAVHEDVGTYCFIARSVNFPVTYEPTVMVAS